MNHSLYNADLRTHLKIVALSLGVAALLLLALGNGMHS
jgi:hypothetical protein